MDPRTFRLLAAASDYIGLIYTDAAPTPERSRLMQNVVVYGCGSALSVELILLMGKASSELRSLLIENSCLYPLPARHVIAHGATAPHLYFPNLTDLSICTTSFEHQGPLSVTQAAFQLFSHMPSLLCLKLSASPSAVRDVYEGADNDQRLPDPPFKLEAFCCAGGLSLIGVSRLIWCSRTTLRDLSITCSWDRTTNILAESVFQSCVIRAAPGVKRLQVTDACTFLDLIRGSAGAFSRLAFLSLDGCSECTADAQDFILSLPRSLLRVSLPAARASFGEHRLRAIADRARRS